MFESIHLCQLAMCCEHCIARIRYHGLDVIKIAVGQLCQRVDGPLSHVGGVDRLAAIDDGMLDEEDVARIPSEQIDDSIVANIGGFVKKNIEAIHRA